MKWAKKIWFLSKSAKIYEKEIRVGEFESPTRGPGPRMYQVTLYPVVFYNQSGRI